MIITDVETWLLDNGEDRIFRYLVYKKMFTPFEQKAAYIDESQYENTQFCFGKIEEAIDLGCGEWLIGIRVIIDDEIMDELEYHKLSEIRLFYFEQDQNLLSKEEDDWEETGGE